MNLLKLEKKIRNKIYKNKRVEIVDCNYYNKKDGKIGFSIFVMYGKNQTILHDYDYRKFFFVYRIAKDMNKRIACDDEYSSNHIPII